MSLSGILFVFLCTLLPARERSVQAQLELAWETQQGAVTYELELRPVAGKGGTLTFKTKSPEFRRVIPAGSYFVRIRSFDAQGRAGEWGGVTAMDVYPPSVELVSPKPLEKVFVKDRPSVLFRWKKEDTAVKYTLLVWDDEKKAFKSEETTGTSLRLELPLGKNFYWKVSFRDRRGVVYEDAREPRRFTVIGKRLEAAQLDKIAAEGEHPEISWRGDPLAQNFQLKLFRKDLLGTEWRPALDESVKGSPPVTVWRASAPLPAGEYRLELISTSASYQPSLPLTHEFLVKPKLGELTEIR